MYKVGRLFLIINIFLFVGCSEINSIMAIAETEPVTTSGDAADDPAIIIDYRNPKESIILGTSAFINSVLNLTFLPFVSMIFSIQYGFLRYPPFAKTLYAVTISIAVTSPTPSAIDK